MMTKAEDPYRYVPGGHGISRVVPAGQKWPGIHTLPHSKTPSSNVGVGLVAFPKHMYPAAQSPSIAKKDNVVSFCHVSAQ